MNDLNKQFNKLIGPLKKMRRTIGVYIFSILQFSFILFSVFSTNSAVKYIASGLLIYNMLLLAHEANNAIKRYRAAQEAFEKMREITDVLELFKEFTKNKEE